MAGRDGSSVAPERLGRPKASFFEKLSQGNYLVLLYFGKWPVAMALLLLQIVWDTLRRFF